MQKLKDAFKYPVILLFFGFICILALVDVIKPDKEMSALENRKLAQAPALTLNALLAEAEKDRWTTKFDEYTRDQFLWRDEWVSMQSALELAQGKLEGGGIWFAKDDYLIPKNSTMPAATLWQVNLESVAQLAARQPGKVTVTMVPSPANILSSKLRWSPPQIDEDALLNEAFATFEAAGARVLDLREDFRAAAEGFDRQVYYHTDHHWTTDGGAVIAYTEYCVLMDRPVAEPNEDLKVEVPDFLGTSFAKSKKFGQPAEPLVYFDLPNTMTITKSDGTVTETGLMDKEKLEEFDKYGAFLHGNNGYSVIEGNGEGSILLIKDSYGNCFAPYLVEAYAKVGVIDLRDWMLVDKLIETEGYDEVLVMYSFDSFTSDTRIINLSDDGQKRAEALAQ